MDIHRTTQPLPNVIDSSRKPVKQSGWLFSLGQLLLFGLAWLAVKTVFRVRARGWEHLPAGGGLLICNHVSYADAVILAVSCPRRIRFLSHDSFQKVPLLGLLLRLAEVLPVSPERPREAIRSAVKQIQEGELVLIFPEGKLSRDGEVDAFQEGFLLVAQKANVPVLPLCLDGLWGSIFSYAGGRFFWKWPQKLPRPVSLQVGQPLLTENMTAQSARQTIIDMGADAYAARPEFQGHVASAILESLCQEPGREAIVDYSTERKALNAATVASLAINLAQQFKSQIAEQRVGIVLPPGIGGSIANLALSLAGKIPVNINFTLGRAAVESCLQRAGIKTLITAQAVREKVAQRFPEFPWTDGTIDIKEAIDGLSKPKLAFWLLAAKCLPARLVGTMAGAPKAGGDAEAALLFTSGSDGEPKGVVLTHRNILGNARQILDCGVFPLNTSLLANLPIFHSFGFTVTLWGVLLGKVKVVYTPSPLDFKLAAKAIAAEKCGILLGTPTFLRPYLTRVEPEALASVQVVVAGAEKTPEGFHQAWEERFPRSHYLEGYGLTETSPVVAVNIPDEFLPQDAAVRHGIRAGSVGRLFPGMAAEVIDQASGQSLPIGKTGILRLKGVNVFPGYLNAPELNAEVLEDGWLKTGDLARLDDEGFLYIEGRLSRFSKLGGEMVPHGTVENAIAQVYGVDKAETPQVAVTARQDPTKGEALVLLTTLDIEAADLRERLSKAGLANLWIPREIKRVEAIPTLASGKLELARMKRMAAE